MITPAKDPWGGQSQVKHHLVKGTKPGTKTRLIMWRTKNTTWGEGEKYKE